MLANVVPITFALRFHIIAMIACGKTTDMATAYACAIHMPNLAYDDIPPCRLP